MTVAPSAPGDVSRTIHPADEMFKTAKISLPELGKASAYYFSSGALVASKVEQYLRSVAFDPARMSLLDFACGYGRVTRHFAKVFQEIVCSDLDPDMLRFVEEITGAAGFLSNVELEKVNWPARRFDVVFSFSLFTHLNPAIWEPWFWALSEMVEPGGLMFISTRGVEFAKRTGEPVQDGERVRFTEKNETAGRLDKAIYGQTTLAREFVDDVLAKHPGRMARLAYFQGGEFDSYQDMHVLTRATDAAAP